MNEGTNYNQFLHHKEQLSLKKSIGPPRRQRFLLINFTISELRGARRGPPGRAERLQQGAEDGDPGHCQYQHDGQSLPGHDSAPPGPGTAGDHRILSVNLHNKLLSSKMSNYFIHSSRSAIV